jgi:phytoene desaturase
MKKKAIIIGSGFGGLSLAIRLQSKGFQVLVLEKNEMPGGHAFQLKKDGYTFDMGPSLITAPGIIQEVFDCAGKRMEDYLETVPLDPYYRIYFHDKTYIDYTGNEEKMKASIAAYSVHDAAQYDRFMAYAKKLYEEVIVNKLGATPFIGWKAVMNFVPKGLSLNAFFPVHWTVARFFKDFRTRFTFSFHPLFIGANPFNAPALYLMIPYLEKVDGVWFSKGGMYSLVQAFVKLFTELGGEIRTNAEVSEIVVENGVAKGVHVNGEYIEADLVVSNAHFAHTYKDLIKSSERKKWSDKKVENLDYSMSCFLLYLGVKKQYPELLHHTLILSERYQGLVGDIFNKKTLPDDFSMYLHVPTRSDPSMAPDGKESMYVLIPVPNLQSGNDWEREKAAYTKKVLDYLEHDFGMKDLQQNIEVCEAFTPDDFRDKRNNYLGSAWGVEPKLLQTAIFRPHNRSEDVKGLYIVGASTHPGAGVPGVLLTAETTEKLIREDYEA